MSNVTVCVRFRPLNQRERKIHGDSVCIQASDAESFIFKDEKEEDQLFCFDRVFYQDSLQADVYDFLARPIVQDTVDGVNGTIITYGQTGAGKTYSMEGPGILEDDQEKKGLLPRVLDGLFDSLKANSKDANYSVKLSMVEIYMEKVRDLFDLSKDNLQIKENKSQGIYLSGATEITIPDTTEALRCLQRGIANRAVGETQMNMSSSRSHCVYIFTIQHVSAAVGRLKNGKLILVDLAGSEKVEKTGAEGKVLDEAKTINKSLSALGNVINALTAGRVNHVPYRDSKLTRILQDALGGDCRTGLLCCSSPSSSNLAESLSTLRFGTRTKFIKPPARPALLNIQPNSFASECSSPLDQITDDQSQCDSYDRVSQAYEKSDSSDRIMSKLRESFSEENVNLLEEIFVMEGILIDPCLNEKSGPTCDETVAKTFAALEEAILELKDENEELKRQNSKLKTELAVCLQLSHNSDAVTKTCFFDMLVGTFCLLSLLTWLQLLLR